MENWRDLQRRARAEQIAREEQLRQDADSASRKTRLEEAEKKARIKRKQDHQDNLFRIEAGRFLESVGARRMLQGIRDQIWQSGDVSTEFSEEKRGETYKTPGITFGRGYQGGPRTASWQYKNFGLSLQFESKDGSRIQLSTWVHAKFDFMNADYQGDYIGLYLPDSPTFHVKSRSSLSDRNLKGKNYLPQGYKQTGRVIEMSTLLPYQMGESAFRDLQEIFALDSAYREDNGLLPRQLK